MKFLKVFWQRLMQEAVRTGGEGNTTEQEFGKLLKEQAPQSLLLKSYGASIDPFLQTLSAPVTQLLLSGLPFLSIGVGAVKLYAELTRQAPTYEEAVVVTWQLAYLAALKEVLAPFLQQPVYGKRLAQIRLSQIVARQVRQLEAAGLEADEVGRSTAEFPLSSVAIALGQALAGLLTEAGLPETWGQAIATGVSWQTRKYWCRVLGSAQAAIAPLQRITLDGQRLVEKYGSIEHYLQSQIDPLPRQSIFQDETIEPRPSYQEMYVQLKVRRLDREGNELKQLPEARSGNVISLNHAVNSHRWLIEELAAERAQRQVLLIQGDAGGGKSVLCRMVAQTARRMSYLGFAPILVRLREVQRLEESLPQTLTAALEQLPLVQVDRHWLTDANTRFLLLLDGLDELRLEGQKEGLREFLQQVTDFQQQSHHQCVITGRPLALQGLERQISQLPQVQRVRLEPLSDELRQQWLDRWQVQVGEVERQAFAAFLHACPQEIEDDLAREPLLLSLLAQLHREQQVNAAMFGFGRSEFARPEIAGLERVSARLQIYDAAVKWVLEKQWQLENLRLMQLEPEDLREFLREAALCVVQSGRETAKLKMLLTRCKREESPVAKLLQRSPVSLGSSSPEPAASRTLNHLLTTVYINPAAIDRSGGIEFTHKSFSEFLFAERLQKSLEDWTELNQRGRYAINDEQLARQIYDLLGYGALTPEMVEMAIGLLTQPQYAPNFKPVELFQRLNQFYQDWSAGYYIDQMPGESLPQIKMSQMRSEGVAIGWRQVDGYTGLNVMILLLELHRYGQLHRKELKDAIEFRPCWQVYPEHRHHPQVLEMIGYTYCISDMAFAKTMRQFLSHVVLPAADLRGVDLNRADLRHADLNRADLSRADLDRADFRHANLRDANLRFAYLSCADLRYAYLSRANLFSANLSGANLRFSYLSSANLFSTNLSDANLRFADLRFADLRFANLRFTDLSDANLSGANLNSADLEKITWNEATNWVGVQGWQTVRNLPESLRQFLELLQQQFEEPLEVDL